MCLPSCGAVIAEIPEGEKDDGFVRPVRVLDGLEVVEHDEEILAGTGQVRDVLPLQLGGLDERGGCSLRSRRGGSGFWVCGFHR